MVKSKRAKRMERHHKRGKGAPLNLVSLMDIFTILVFFLLVNSSDVEVLPNAKDVQLPESIAEEKAKETVVIVIGDDDIIVQGIAGCQSCGRLGTSRQRHTGAPSGLAVAERPGPAPGSAGRYRRTGSDDHG